MLMYRGQGKFLYLVIRVIVPTVPDVPEPRFSPQALEAIDQDECVEKPSERKEMVFFQLSCSLSECECECAKC